MDNKVINDFIGVFNPFNVIDIESLEKVESYKRDLNRFYAQFVERIDNNYFELSEIGTDSKYYLRKVIEKLKNHKEILFNTQEENVIYEYDKFIIVDPVQKGDPRS